MAARWEYLGLSLSLSEMKELLKDLKTARYSGTLRVKFLDRDVQYKSDSEMAAAISALEAEIAKAEGKAKPRHMFTTFKSGL